MYKIAGCDLSINGSGIVKVALNENLDVVDKEYIGFSLVKKLSGDFHGEGSILYFKKNQFKFDQDQNEWMKQMILDFVYDIECAAIEGYAYGSTGAVFSIAEFCGLIKHELYNSGFNLRIYDPPSIKMYATGKGNSEKKAMQDSYDAYTGLDKFDLSMLEDWRSPKTDIIDAWWITKLLQCELKLRKGLISLKDLTEKQIQIFNRTTKGNPQNLLATDFIHKEKKQ